LRQHTFFIAAWWGRQDDFREIIGPIRSQSPSVTINFAHWWDNLDTTSSMRLVTSS
jgi:hypothetical protein